MEETSGREGRPFETALRLERDRRRPSSPILKEAPQHSPRLETVQSFYSMSAQRLTILNPKPWR